MGFLMGAYGKLMTGKLVRDIQFQMIGIQSRLRRVTREIADKTKMYEAQERNMRNRMQTQMQNVMYGWAYSQGMPMAVPGSGQMGLNAFGQQLVDGTAANCFALAGGGSGYANFGAFNSNQMQQYSAMQQMVQMQFAQANSLWQNSFEMQKEADLQALKDLEDSLQLENDNLKSRLQLAQQEYEAYKQEEKADSKSIVAEYTSQA